MTTKKTGREGRSEKKTYRYENRMGRNLPPAHGRHYLSTPHSREQGTIRLSDQLTERLEQQAAITGQSLDEYIEDLLWEHLEDLQDDQAIIEARRDAEPTRSWEEYLASRGERVPTDLD